MKLLMIFVENYIILTKKLSFSQLFYLSFKMIVKYRFSPYNKRDSILESERYDHVY